MNKKNYELRKVPSLYVRVYRPLDEAKDDATGPLIIREDISTKEQAQAVIDASPHYT